MATWEPLPYPTLSAQSFPMPDDDQIRNVAERSGAAWDNNAPSAPDNAFGFPPYPADAFSNAPAYYPPASESSFTYPDPSLPYPPVPASGMPSYPSEHYPPTSVPSYSPESSSSTDGVNYVDDRDAPGKKSGLGKALNTGKNASA